jgi:septal ring factor EnvC (AmiA/AmiB activator)
LNRLPLLAMAAAPGFRAIPLAAFLLFTASVLPGHAQSGLDEAKKRRDAEAHRLTETDLRAKEIQADMIALRQEREKLNGQLLQTANLIQASEAQLSTIESRIQELEEQEKLKVGSLEARRGSMSGLLAAMQRMGRNPPPVMITRREDALSMVRSAMLIGAAFPELRAQAQALADELAQIVEVKTKISDEAAKLRAETQRFTEMRASMAALVESKKQSLTERQEELAQVRRATADLARSVTDLNELITGQEKLIAEKTRLGAYERQLQEEAKREQAVADAATPSTPQPPPLRPSTDTGSEAKAAEPAAPPPAPKQTKQAALPPDKAAPKTRSDAQPAVTLAPGDRLAMAAPGRIQPAIAFHLAKGRLPLPAAGRRVLNYGDRTQRGKSEGIVLETRSAAQITAPSDGWVMYAGEFRSYGHILIINAGGGYHILLAGLSHTDVQVGQFVLAGEPVGMMPAAPKTLQGKAQDNAPVLYVEFRKDQKPIDPEPWWVASAKKVQG